MPKGFQTYQDFSGGVNTKTNPKNIEANELSEAKGILCDEKGAVRTSSPPAELTGLRNIAATISPGRGLFSFKTDYSYSDTTNSLTARESEYICIADAANSEIDLYGYNDNGNDHGLKLDALAAGLGSGSALEAEYYYVDGALRVADASFDSNNTVYWFGNIGTDTKKKLLGVELDREWIAQPNNLAPPTVGLVAPVLSDTAIASSSTDVLLGLAAQAALSSDIAGFTDPSSPGYTTVTSSGHGLENGMVVVITGSTSYNGEHVISGKTTNTFNIPVQFVVNDGAAYWMINPIADNFQGWATPVSAANSASRWFLALDVDELNIWKITSVNEGTEVLTTEANAIHDWDNEDFEIFPYPGDGILLEAVSSIGSNQGTWPKGDYEFAQSFIYEGDQESKVVKLEGDDITMQSNEVLYVRVHISGVDSVAENNAVINERLIGGRVYTRKSGSDGFWALLVDMDFRVHNTKIGGGTRLSTIDDYDVWHTVRDATGGSGSLNGFTASNFEGFKSALYTVKRPSIESYENLNGFSSGEHALSFGESAGYGYKTSVVAGSRVFVGNVNYKDSDGILKRMGDTILYTPNNKFDTFPSSFKLDIGGSDGDEFTALAYSGGALFAFKKQSLFVIDVSSASDAGWKLANKHVGLGVAGPWAVINTGEGIAWVSKSGVYLYIGNNLINLSSPKISFNDWASFYGTTNQGPSIGFDPSSNKVLVSNNVNAGTSIKIFNIETKTLTDSYTLATSGTGWGLPGGSATSMSNMITFTGSELQDGSNAAINPNGGVLIFADPNTGSGSDADLFSLSLATTGTSAFTMVTKDDDLGYPNVIKKIYEVNVEYISTDASTAIDVRYEIDGNDTPDSSSTALGTNQSLTGVAGFDNANVINFKPATPISCRSIAFRITNYNEASGSAVKLKILSISVRFRAILKRTLSTETT
jgi:hypothetical protein